MSSTTQKKDQAHETFERAKDTVKETASNVTDKVKDMASNVGQAAGNAASAVGHAAGNVATTVGHKAEDATAAAGRGMQNLGSTVRDKAPDSGFLGTAADKVAGGLESAGKYLEDKNLSGMAEDITGLIRRNPIPALLIGIGLGFLLARTLRS
jgi:phage-related protein